MDDGIDVAAGCLAGVEVRLSCVKVREPRFVRYAFSDCPDVNLTNERSLPAEPFRTDRSGVAGLGFMPLDQWEMGSRNEPLGDPKAGIDSDLDALAAYHERRGDYAEALRATLRQLEALQAIINFYALPGPKMDFDDKTFLKLQEAIHQRPHEVPLAQPPVQQQVRAQEHCRDHPHAVVHPARL